MINCIYVCNSFIIADKPPGIPTAPLTTEDTNSAVLQLANQYPDILNVKGLKQLEYGLIHRIDTLTRGLIIVARNQESFDKLITSQKLGKCIKEYTAFCDKTDFVLPSMPVFPQNLKQKILNGENIIVESYFRAFGPKGSQVRPVSIDSSEQTKSEQKKTGYKKYSTEIKLNFLNDGKIKAQCKITNGFRHQVRCHLAWAGFPVCNDPVYNQNLTTDNMFFYASAISFPHPVTEEQVRFSLPQLDKMNQ